VFAIERGIIMISRRLSMAMAVAVFLQAISALAAEPALDYGFYKTRVEPIFLKKRPDHVRCVVCHAHANTAFKLEELAHGSKAWTEEQSRRNFEMVSKLVVPGNPDASHFLKQPLAPQAGGNAYHSGGRQFASKNDPDWKVLAQWVNGEKVSAKK
jgi:hypothetical protein